MDPRIVRLAQPPAQPEATPMSQDTESAPAPAALPLTYSSHNDAPDIPEELRRKEHPDDQEDFVGTPKEHVAHWIEESGIKQATFELVNRARPLQAKAAGVLRQQRSDASPKEEEPKATGTPLAERLRSASVQMQKTGADLTRRIKQTRLPTALTAAKRSAPEESALEPSTAPASTEAAADQATHAPETPSKQLPAASPSQIAPSFSAGARGPAQEEAPQAEPGPSPAPGAAASPSSRQRRASAIRRFRPIDWLMRAYHRVVALIGITLLLIFSALAFYAVPTHEAYQTYLEAAPSDLGWIDRSAHYLATERPLVVALGEARCCGYLDTAISAYEPAYLQLAKQLTMVEIAGWVLPGFAALFALDLLFGYLARRRARRPRRSPTLD